MRAHSTPGWLRHAEAEHLAHTVVNVTPQRVLEHADELHPDLAVRYPRCTYPRSMWSDPILASDPNRIVLLVCEEADSQPLRDAIDVAEHPWQVHTETVTTLAAAFGRRGQGNVDLALLDLALPGSAGVATFVQARAMAAATAPHVSRAWWTHSSRTLTWTEPTC